MSLPPGFIDELRTRVSLSSVVGRKVTWDMRKSNLGKGDMWAPCPFHQEKSASFHVDDRKGFYYCFGCHAKGDAISFVKETENVAFIEAVEVLAREAGMTMPARDPGAAQKSDRRTQLVAVMEEAVKWFRLQLATSAAAEARAYLVKRRLTPDAQDRWDIGYAPDQRTALFQALTQKGIAPDLIVDAGLCAKADDGSIYDRFRGRIIFPIRDGRGRAISLGGRAMAADARAKYLNGPETDLFDKGRNLYNHAPAREAAGKGQPLIVAEGYMDVIALSEAGFKATVAPLGTAITEEQLRLMWRIHPAPVIALDGDTAGQRAAARLIDLALPLIESGQELLFARLPSGQDPDDLLRSGSLGDGVAMMRNLIANAKPLADVLWLREASDRQLDSPERIASVKKNLRGLVARVKDKDLRNLYEFTFTQQINRSLFAMGRSPKGGTAAAKLLPRPETKRSLLATTGAVHVIEFIREIAILAVLLVHKSVVKKFEDGLAHFDMQHHGHADFLSAILSHHEVDSDMTYRARIIHALGRDEVEAVLANTHVRVIPAVKQVDNVMLAIATVEEQMAFLTADREHRREIADSKQEMDGLVDEGLTWRVNRANEAVRTAARFGMESEGSVDPERDALSRHLHEMSDKQVWIKKNH